MALSDIKTNIQNKKAKMNSRQMAVTKLGKNIVKIIEYTHTHIHP